MVGFWKRYAPFSHFDSIPRQSAANSRPLLHCLIYPAIRLSLYPSYLRSIFMCDRCGLDAILRHHQFAYSAADNGPASYMGVDRLPYLGKILDCTNFTTLHSCIYDNPWVTTCFGALHRFTSITLANIRFMKFKRERKKKKKKRMNECKEKEKEKTSHEQNRNKNKIAKRYVASSLNSNASNSETSNFQNWLPQEQE